MVLVGIAAIAQDFSYLQNPKNIVGNIFLFREYHGAWKMSSIQPRLDTTKANHEGCSGFVEIFLHGQRRDWQWMLGDCL